MRLAGEDSRRGTFSQRHAALDRLRDGQAWIPLDKLPGAKAKFWVYDSLLSEYAALGFEYGYAQRRNQGRLVMWEAQFGDFINGAQMIIDQYIVAAEDKWGQPTGSSCSCPTATRVRAPSTRRRASSGSSRCPPRTTSRCATPRRRRSTSTSCAGRCTATSASR